MSRRAPECKIGAPCGAKCQPKRFRCPSEQGEQTSASIDKVSSLLSSSQVYSSEELREIFEEADNLIKPEIKKENREKIKDFKDPKAAKKALIAEEEKAWVYARAHRLKEKLEKSGEDDKLLSEINNYLQGIANSNEKITSEAKAFLDKRTAEKRVAKEKGTVSKKTEEKAESISKEVIENSKKPEEKLKSPSAKDITSQEEKPSEILAPKEEKATKAAESEAEKAESLPPISEEELRGFDTPLDAMLEDRMKEEVEYNKKNEEKIKEIIEQNKAEGNNDNAIRLQNLLEINELYDKREEAIDAARNASTEEERQAKIAEAKELLGIIEEIKQNPFVPYGQDTKESSENKEENVEEADTEAETTQKEAAKLPERAKEQIYDGPPLARSYEDLTSEEIKIIKDKNVSYADKIAIFLTDEGKKLQQEIEDIKVSLESPQGQFRTELIALDVNFSMTPLGKGRYSPGKEQMAVWDKMSGGAPLEEVITEKVEPIRALLQEKIELAREVNELHKEELAQLDPTSYAYREASMRGVPSDNNPRYREIKEKWNEINNDIQSRIEPDYEDAFSQTISEYQLIKDLGLKNYPTRRSTRFYEDNISMVAQKVGWFDNDVQTIRDKQASGEITAVSATNQLKQLYGFASEENALTGRPLFTLDEARKLDSEYGAYKSQRKALYDGYEKIRDQTGIREKINLLDQNVNRAISGLPPEDTSKYNRNGAVSDNLKSRNLPQGDISDPSDAKLQQLVDERVPMMAISAKNLRQLFKPDGDGEFKNLFDFDSKKGIAGHLAAAEYERYKNDRIEKEYEALGVPRGASADQRPVYGFMGNFNDLTHMASEVRGYGEIIVQFKPEVKDNITVTIDDSMGGDPPNQKASPANKVSKQSMPDRNRAVVNLEAKDHRDIIHESSRGNYRTPRYIEWQGGGRLRIDNIDKINFPADVFFSMPKSFIAQMRAAGIEIVVIAPQ